MAKKSLGQLLKNADILQRAAKLTKNFGELNDTILQILRLYLDKVQVQFTPDRPHDWDNHLAVLEVIHGGYILKIPAPELKALDKGLTTKVRIKMNHGYVVENAPHGVVFEFQGAEYYVYTHPTCSDEIVIRLVGSDTWDFVDPETAPAGLFAAWAHKLEEAMPAARKKAREMFDNFALWPDGEWEIEVDEDGNFAGQTWVDEPHSPYAWAIYEANKHQWMLDKASQIAEIMDPVQRREAWREFDVNITDRAHVSDGWFHQRRYSGDEVTLRGKAKVEDLSTRQTTSTGSTVTSYTVVADSEDTIVFVWNCDGGDEDSYKLSVIDPKALAASS